MKDIGFKLYMFFVASWYLQLPGRIPILGTIRFDMLLFGFLVILALMKSFNKPGSEDNSIDKSLKILIIYIIVSLPFTEWPGTVVKYGLQQFIKASFFFFFTVIFINSEKKLKVFISIYLSCQIFRVLEPLYLHITEGYWGSSASMLGGQEFMMRLAGSPYDTVNPNGLAFIIVTIIPFLYYFSSLSWKHKALFGTLLPPLIYALILTGSRSGLIGLSIFLAFLIYKSSKRFLLTSVVLASSLLVFINLSPDMQDRYLSIFMSDKKHSATMEDRITVPIEMSKLILRKPFVGHGLGTSIEANANYGTILLLPHNLYVELGIEIGLIGMIIFLLFIKSIIYELMRAYSHLRTKLVDKLFLLKCSESILILLLINLLFTFASYGLLVPVWYFLGGLIVVLKKLSVVQEVK